jgi:adenylate kinase family enzyme
MERAPRRYVVVGISGAGKSTLASALASTCGVPHVELDELFWGPDWTPKPTAQFRRLVAAAVSQPAWVVDGNYSVARDIVWARAATIVWLRFPLWRVLWRVFRRTLRRLRTREALWHGNRESLRRTLSRESILLWVLTAYWRRDREFAALMRSDAFPDATWIVLRSPAQTRAFIASIEQREGVAHLRSSRSAEGAGARL